MHKGININTNLTNDNGSILHLRDSKHCCLGFIILPDIIVKTCVIVKTVLIDE